jgi:hypothetical protein
MFVRPIVRQETKPRTAELTRSEESPAHDETVQRLERTREDLRSASPLRLLGRTVLTVAGAFLVAIALMVAVPRQPALDVVAGEPVPSVVVPVGTVLAKADALTESQNHEVTLSGTSDSTLMLVWDYAVEDGDMVSILVNGNPLGESFTIYHGAKVLRVPANADVQVIGTHDGGGGITYAVNFPEAGKSIVNGVQAGDVNLYRLASHHDPLVGVTP